MRSSSCNLPDPRQGEMRLQQDGKEYAVKAGQAYFLRVLYALFPSGQGHQRTPPADCATLHTCVEKTNGSSASRR